MIGQWLGRRQVVVVVVNGLNNGGNKIVIICSDKCASATLACANLIEEGRYLRIDGIG